MGERAAIDSIEADMNRAKVVIADLREAAITKVLTEIQELGG